MESLLVIRYQVLSIGYKCSHGLDWSYIGIPGCRISHGPFRHMVLVTALEAGRARRNAIPAVLR